MFKLSSTIKVLAFLFIFSVMSIVVSCYSPMLHPEQMMGKTKDEVIDLSFASSPRNRHGKLIIVTFDINGSSVTRFYSMADAAKRDEHLMQKYDRWGIDFRNKFSFSLFAEKYYLFLHFKNGKVIECKKRIWKSK